MWGAILNGGSCHMGKISRRVANHPGAVKHHWFTRQPRFSPAKLVILVPKLDTCV